MSLQKSVIISIDRETELRGSLWRDYRMGEMLRDGYSLPLEKITRQGRLAVDLYREAAGEGV